MQETADPTIERGKEGDAEFESLGVESDSQGGVSWERLCRQEFEAKIQELDGVPRESASPTSITAMKTELDSVKKGKLVRGIPVASMPEFCVGRPVDEGEYGLSLDAFPSVFNEGVGDEQEARLVTVTSEKY